MPFLLADAAENVGYACAGIVLVVAWIAAFVGGILLLIAPLKIWQWVKRVSRQLDDLHSLLSKEITAQRKDGKYVNAIYNHVKNLDEVLAQPSEEAQ